MKIHKLIWINLLIAAVVMFCACGTQKALNQISSETAQSGKTGNEVMPNLKASSSLRSDIAKITGGCQVVNEGDKILQNGYEITVHGIKVTKKKGDWQEMTGDYHLDQQNRITDEKSFVIMDVEVYHKEKNKDEVSFCWGNLNLIYFDQKRVKEYTGAVYDFNGYELESIEGTTEAQKNNTDLFIKNYRVGTGAREKLVYVADDNVLYHTGNHFMLQLNLTGTSLQYLAPEDYSFIYLKSLENLKNEE
ncbi:MAG: hypothetical protein LKI32_01205 [Lachnospiraceae bacterium]|jgi:hypothetical protein|nr:hypothetical protein [Lachnospiraceae bacterium]MCI1656162.1 hypothetical protein [Lachnospiraceae bacterium]MCI2194644.1 hypothetical protein [Lachnospiraceae bacterium]